MTDSATVHRCFFFPGHIKRVSGQTCHGSDVDHNASLSTSVFAHVVQRQVGDPNDTHLHTQVLILKRKCVAVNDETTGGNTSIHNQLL